MVGARKAVDDGADKDAAVFTAYGTMGGTCTAAYVAARYGRANVLGDVLLPAPVSADPNTGNTANGRTPCHIACASDQPDAVAVLLAHGADPNRADKDGRTPCMMAARCGGNTACLRALAEGAARQGVALDVNAVATGGYWKGKTALDIARERNEAGAAACLRDELGALRAADLALRAAGAEGAFMARRRQYDCNRPGRVGSLLRLWADHVVNHE